MFGIILIMIFLSSTNCLILNSGNFKFYWNVPTKMCKRYGIHFNEVFQDYGIVQNNNDLLRGNKIAILYDPGMFPALIKYTNGTIKMRNGGVPQQGNLLNHLDLFEKHLNEQIDSDFSGIGIIDFESWRPIFRQHWSSLEIYKHLSIDIEHKRYPGYNKKALERKATVRFERYARIFMEETIKRAQLLRPNAKWSYYAYPYCFNVQIHDPKQSECPSQVKHENDGMNWLWTIQNISMPSVYLNSQLSNNENLNRITGRIHEALRINKRFNLNTKIIPYFWFKYQDNRDRYLSKNVILNSFKTMINNKIDGTVIWGSSRDVDTQQKCEDLKFYLHHTLGPMIINATSHTQFSPYNIIENEIFNVI